MAANDNIFTNARIEQFMYIDGVDRYDGSQKYTPAPFAHLRLRSDATDLSGDKETYVMTIGTGNAADGELLTD